MKSESKELLSVIVPCFNQGSSIVNILQNIEYSVRKINMPYEIIAVVDGTDVNKTYKAAKSIKLAKIKVFGYTTNRGKGYALRFGMARSHGNVIAYIDAGRDLNPDGLEMLLAHYRWYKADIIVGSKWHSVSIVHYPLWRKVLSRSYGLLVRILFNLRIRDTQLGMKLFRRDVLEHVLPRLLVKQYAFDIELLVVAEYLGYTRIYEAPVELNWNVVESTVTHNLVPTVWQMLIDTLAVYYRLRILHYYDSTSKRKWEYDPDLDFKVNVS